MTDTDMKPMGYWDDLAASERSIVAAIEQIEGKDGWTVHAVILSGESDSDLFGCVIRSKLGDKGLLLSERMVQLPKDLSDTDEIGMLDNTITRRVSGPLAQALARGYARTDNDRLAADDLDADPLALSALGEEIEQDPRELVETIGDDPHEEIAESKTEYVECNECGTEVSKSDAVNLGGPLGVDHWLHADSCPTEEEENV